jgi:hypothetical protein
VTFYQLLRLLVQTASRSGMMKSDDAFAALELIKKLESVNAFGTQVAINKGNDIRNV